MIIKEPSDPLPLTFSPPALSPELLMSTGPSAPPTYNEAISTLEHATGSGSTDANATAGTIPIERAHLYSRPEKSESLGWSGSRDIVAVEVVRRNETELISHDRALDDPDLLEEWIRYQAGIPPSLKLKCRGSHKEIRTRTETQHHDGKAHRHQKSEEETVIDFNFFIDLQSLLPNSSGGDNQNGITLSTTSPSSPAYRGSQSLSLHPSLAPTPPRSNAKSAFSTMTDDTSPGHPMSKSDRKNWKKWSEQARLKGFPVWKEMTKEFVEGMQKGKGKDKGVKVKSRRSRARNGSGGDGRGREGFVSLPDVEQLERDETGDSHRDITAGDTFLSDPESTSSPPPAFSPTSPLQATLKDWTRAYCFSKKPLKEFVMTKEVWGWDLEAMMIAIRGLIASTGYRGEVEVGFVLGESDVLVKPDNLYSRLTSQNSFITFLLCITLVFPALLLYKRFRGGARYQTVRASYALKCYIPNEPIQPPTQTLNNYPYDKPTAQTPSTTQSLDDTRNYRFYGEKEGVFMRKWEDAIKGGVNARFQGDLAKAGSGIAMGGRMTLDGYYD